MFASQFLPSLRKEQLSRGSCHILELFPQDLCTCAKLNPVSTIRSIIKIMHEHTCCTLLLLLYLFSLCVGLADGEPQTHFSYNNNSTSTLQLNDLSNPSISGTTRLSHKSSLMESNRYEGRSQSLNGGDYIDYVVRQTTAGPHQIAAIANQSKAVDENTASVIASSFRNIDGPTTNSKEDGIAVRREGSTVKKKTKKCQGDALKKCIDGLPPMNDTGIPTSPEAVNTACRIYDSGINCFDSWAKKCLPVNQRQLVRASITGAHEMYSFLCKDPKFRTDYLKHKDCYRQLSPYWDDCSRQFIDGLRRNIRNNYTAFCCIRLEFVTCVSKYSSRLCSFEATKFSMKMAETLIRTRTRTPMPDCIHIHPQNCIPIIEGNGAARFRSNYNAVLFGLAFTVLSFLVY